MKKTAVYLLAACTATAVAQAETTQSETAPPTPAIVSPGVTGTPATLGNAPSDAIVLFDGTNTDQWENNKQGKEVGWKLVEDGAMECQPRSGSIRTKEPYGYGQYHIEWRTPPEVKGNGQGRGNSGVFPLGGPEVQVLDSYDNVTYIDGQAGAIYKWAPPLVNACRAPGTWQTYDIIAHPPKHDKDGKLIRSGAYTVLHNGVLIQDFTEIPRFKSPDHQGKLSLQDHGNPVRYRNIWFRPARAPLPRPPQPPKTPKK